HVALERFLTQWRRSVAPCVGCLNRLLFVDWFLDSKCHIRLCSVWWASIFKALASNRSKYSVNPSQGVADQGLPQHVIQCLCLPGRCTRLPSVGNTGFPPLDQQCGVCQETHLSTPE